MKTEEIKNMAHALLAVQESQFQYVVPEEIEAHERTAFHGAAAGAAKAGKSHFTFNGKKYPVTMKKDTAKKIADSVEHDEEVDLDEGYGPARTTKAANALMAYAKKSGGIDKKDMMAVASKLQDFAKVGTRSNPLPLDHWKKTSDGLTNLLKKMDTDPRDKVIEIIMKHDPTLVRGLAARAGFKVAEEVKEANAPKGTHKPNNGSPDDEGLSPSAKKERDNKTAISKEVDAPEANKLNFAKFRAMNKKSPMRSNDKAIGDTAIKPGGTPIKDPAAPKGE